MITIENKIEFISTNANKKVARKILGISPSRFLMMEKAKKIDIMVKQKLNSMTEEKIDLLLKEIKE